MWAVAAVRDDGVPEVMIYAGKDDYAGRRDGRCAHPNTVWGRVAPDKVAVNGLALPLARVVTLRILVGTFSRALVGPRMCQTYRRTPDSVRSASTNTSPV